MSAMTGPTPEIVGSPPRRVLIAEDEALVDSLVPAGHPSTPGYSDPAYPLEGRLARTG